MNPKLLFFIVSDVRDTHACNSEQQQEAHIAEIFLTCKLEKTVECVQKRNKMLSWAHCGGKYGENVTRIAKYKCFENPLTFCDTYLQNVLFFPCFLSVSTDDY